MENQSDDHSRNGQNPSHTGPSKTKACHGGQRQKDVILSARLDVKMRVHAQLHSMLGAAHEVTEDGHRAPHKTLGFQKIFAHTSRRCKKFLRIFRWMIQDSKGERGNRSPFLLFNRDAYEAPFPRARNIVETLRRRRHVCRIACAC
jgi:hypothetical protein